MTSTSGRTRRPKRLRLDQLLVDRGLASTRDRARALILARDVRVDGDLALRAAAPVAVEAELSVQAPPRYVSRGGLKLERALEYAGERGGVPIAGARCLDIGSSTGGFTDCLLQHGAAHVTAVDVDYGELATRLRDDPRVEVRERTNARFLEPLDIAVDLVTLDVAFISLTTVLPAVLRSLRPGGDVLALVKPQFEAAREQVQRGGVVHDPAVHAATVARVALWAIERGMRVRGVIRSPLVGPAGNREFFLWLRQG
jgi:23S rRNA (cytidine1920-2'-O)/16S rRNA (cytidine1409-2'-O)-methyltransferase